MNDRIQAPTSARFDGMAARARPAAKVGFFEHHGAWAPGVRMFRTLQFRVKASIVSATFLLPIALLAAGLWQSTHATIEFVARERAGVTAMRALVPVLDGVLHVRFATRAMFGGFDAGADRQQAWDRTAKEIAALGQAVAAEGDPIGLAPSISTLAAAWQATASSLDAKDDKGLSVFAPVTATLVTIMARLGDESNLVLDPSLDSIYLVNALVLTLPTAAEDLARLWGWSTYASAKGGLDAKDARKFVVWSANTASELAQAKLYFGRAMGANPSLKAQLDLAPIEVALAFHKEATAAVEAGNGDARALYTNGSAALAGLFKVYGSGLATLDALVTARSDAAQRARNVRFAAVAACLLVAAYLFHAFYLVTQGGLNEVRRHLDAMADGDLTTNPNPWGKDEAATLMLSLHDMQSALRNIVLRVRASSGSIVDASSEIAAASMDLSGRTEQAAANLEQSAASIEQISATVNHTAESVRQAAQLASGNAQTAVRGGTVVGQVVNTMRDINVSSKKIGDIIGTIDGIAFQTNILALNAAVEAARAGDQGRGFAVVASEVRSLAQRSALAAREIKTLIGASVENMEVGTQVVKGAGDTMQELVSNASRMHDLLAGIATASAQQSSGVTQVGAAVNELDRMTQQNAALVEQTAAAAAALEAQALGLATEVARFRLPAGC